MREVGFGFGKIREGSVRCRRNIVPGHEGFGEGFGTFQLCGGLRGAKGGDASGLEAIRNSSRKRVFRADDDEVYGFVFGNRDDMGEIGD